MNIILIRARLSIIWLRRGTNLQCQLALNTLGMQSKSAKDNIITILIQSLQVAQNFRALMDEFKQTASVTDIAFKRGQVTPQVANLVSDKRS